MLGKLLEVIIAHTSPGFEFKSIGPELEAKRRNHN